VDVRSLLIFLVRWSREICYFCDISLCNTFSISIVFVNRLVYKSIKENLTTSNLDEDSNALKEEDVV